MIAGRVTLGPMLRSLCLPESLPASAASLRACRHRYVWRRRPLQLRRKRPLSPGARQRRAAPCLIWLSAEFHEPQDMDPHFHRSPSLEAVAVISNRATGQTGYYMPLGTLGADHLSLRYAVDAELGHRPAMHPAYRHWMLTSLLLQLQLRLRQKPKLVAALASSLAL